MIETFKKGQMVPRRLRLAVAAEAKAQHCVTFGCDVRVEGRRVTALSDGPCFYVSRMGRRMNNGTFKKVGLTVRDVQVFCASQGAVFCASQGAAFSAQPADGAAVER